MTERIPVFIAGLVAAAVLAPVAHAKPAPLTTVTCGQVVTKSIRVANDLSGCEPYGLEIGAPGVTVDLNGHTIAGTGDSSFTAGVYNSHQDRVTVRNGTVRNFLAGVYSTTSAWTTIDRMKAVDNLQGYATFEAFGAAITNSSARGGQMGVNLGLLTNRSRVSRFTASDTEQGVVVNVLSRGNVVERNVFDGTNIGVHLSEAESNTISRNRAMGNFIGILVETFSNDNLIVQNDITGARTQGIRVQESSDNVLRDNRVVGTAGDGIFVTEPGSGNVLARNRAFDNGQLGINAASAAVDGGGNRAHGNGDPRQCVGVVCRR